MGCDTKRFTRYIVFLFSSHDIKTIDQKKNTMDVPERSKDVTIMYLVKTIRILKAATSTITISQSET